MFVIGTTRRRQWQATPVLLPRKSHGRKSLVGCSLWGRYESDTTERLHFHFSPSWIGEGNGNPLQCSCLENLRDGRAWWAAIYGVTQSRTRLKRLSSSSSLAAGATFKIDFCTKHAAEICHSMRKSKVNLWCSQNDFPLLNFSMYSFRKWNLLVNKRCK